MRNFLLFSFCIFLFQLASSQNYTPVIINGQIFFKTELETTAGVIDAEVTVANFEQINGQLYNRVFFKRGLEADMLVGYLREDPGLGQMYFRTATNSTEFLVYDISLEVGSIVSLQARWCDGQNNDQATVVAVNDLDGRREIVFDRQVGESGICETLRFIEGVGPTASVIFPYFRTAILQNGVAQRICHASRNAAIFYPPNTSTDLCGLTITNTIELSPTLLQVFPNPVSGQLNIQGLEGSELVEVFTATGQLMLRELHATQVDCSGWTAGMYVLRVGNRVARFVVR